MHIHEDDYFLIVSDICGASWVIIGILIGIDPIFMSIILLGKLAEMFIRYKRYYSKSLNLGKSIICPIKGGLRC